MDVEAVVSVVIREITNLLTEESKTFEKVRDEVEKVLAELSHMQSIFDNAEHQEQTINELLFLSKVYSTRDAIESFSLAETYLKRMGFVKKNSLIIANGFKLCREVPYEMDFSENISRLKLEMNRISKEIPIFENGIPTSTLAQQQGYNPQLSDAYYAPNKENPIFKKDAGKLLKLRLTNNSKPLQILSVFGDDGIGEKAHVKAIYKELKIHKKFTCSTLVVVKTEWSVRSLMMAILQQVTGLKVEKKLTDEELKGRLHGILKREKYLIVIIDIKSRELLEDLRGALPDAYNGSRVVFTTSNKEAASYADVSSRYHFQTLDMEDGLKFLIEKIWGNRRCTFSSESMENFKNIIAESCHGTLLRIELLAGLLSTREEIYEEWSKVFMQLDIATKSPSFDVLVFCYDDVPMHLKPCLLYLTLFRKGSEIPVRRLLRLWLAEGFVIPSRGIIPEDLVEGYLEDLVKRNMVEITKRRSDGSPNKCRMIGALHDIFLPRALKIGLFHLHQKPDEHSNAIAEHRFEVRRVVEYTDIIDYCDSGAFNPNIQSYVSFNVRKKDMPAVMVRLFLRRITRVRGFGLLKVLDLEGVYQPRLPENLGNLFHLRYLGLRSTFMGTLPSLDGLLYLETLDIKHTHITTLPSSIWSMKRIRHLCLNGAPLDLYVRSTKHKAPSQLHTLWGLFVDEKIAKKVGLYLSRMTNLRKLDITIQSFSSTTTTTTTTACNSSYEEIVSWIFSLSSLQSLRLKFLNKIGQPSELIIKPLSSLENLSQLYLLRHFRESLSWYQIPQGLKVLTLSVSQLGEDPMPILSQLKNLMVLRLRGASYVGEEMHCPENGFPALRVLKLWKLEELKLLTLHEGAMQNLRTMEIRSCRKLKELPVSLLQIQCFDNLILTNMPESFVSAIRNKKKNHTKIVVKELDF